MFISDKPISKKNKDKFSRSEFSENLTKAILEYKDPDSFVIGLYGEWGSGKKIKKYSKAFRPVSFIPGIGSTVGSFLDYVGGWRFFI